ncbi:MAG: ABC transporter ATP-binding protein [Clostridia bacterium]|nr:ABC transporter ATP-binding protein [Clostridia bacterium]
MKLIAEGIRRSFFRNKESANTFNAVEKTNFILPEGELTEIIGRSGSGKSTFANILAGLLKPSEGKVFIDGKDIYELEDKARSEFRNKHIGMIPQEQTGLRSLTVLENVLLPVSLYKDASKKESFAKELLKMVGIEDLWDVYSNELSGGELRRMVIARALINEPEIIIADEPTGDLDDETTNLVLKLLREAADRGASVLMNTHERKALAYADTVYRMDKGVLKPFFPDTGSDFEDRR